MTDRQTNAAVDWVGITGMASETVVGFSAVREVVPPPRDTNAPVLVDHDPPDGRTNVWVGTSVRFEFDRPMVDVVSIGWSTNIDGARMSCQWSGGNAPQTFLYCNYAEPLPSDAVVTWVLNPTGATGPAMAGTNGVALPANRYSGSFRTMKTGSTNLVGVGVYVGRTFRQNDEQTIVEEDEAGGFVGPSGVYAYFDGEVAGPFQGSVTLPDGTILDEFPDWGLDYHSIDLPEGTLEEWDALESKAPIAFDLRPGTGGPLKATVLLDMGVEGLPPRILRFGQVQSVDPKRDFKLEWEIPGGGGEYFYQSFNLYRSGLEPENPDEEDPFQERYRFEDLPVSVAWPDWSGFFEPSPNDRAWVIPAGALAPGALYEIRLTAFRYSDLEVSGPPGTWGSFDYMHTLLFTLRTTGDPNAEPWIELGPTTLPSATPGVPLNVPLQASGGRAPYRWSLVAGSELPAGVTLTSDGRLTGTPEAEGVFQFGVRVVDTPSRVLEAYPQSTAARTYRLQVGSGGPPPEARPVLALDRSAGAGVLGFGFPSRSGSSYRLESSRDLREWSLVRRVAGTGSTVVVRESVGASEPGRFFRVVVE
ncbi:MAG: putative Ig domain-containing protein [Verrucomicrobiales bacterium]|nr:putative Ig domain-containing protein [Verrucomicrobiales bacterium]